MKVSLKEYEEYIPFYILENTIDNDNVYAKIYDIINDISINGLHDRKVGYINNIPTYYFENTYNTLHISYRVLDTILNSSIRYDTGHILRPVVVKIFKKYIEGNPDICITDVPYTKANL